MALCHLLVLVLVFGGVELLVRRRRRRSDREAVEIDDEVHITEDDIP
jgi:hypothetical protein